MMDLIPRRDQFPMHFPVMLILAKNGFLDQVTIKSSKEIPWFL